MASGGHLRPVGDEAGRSWDDWNADLAPRLDDDAREPRHNHNHDPRSGRFAPGHGGPNSGLPHRASTAAGHPVKSEVTGVENYAAVGGPTVHGAPVPELPPARVAAIENRVLRSAPAATPGRPRFAGRDEEDVLLSAMPGHDARSADTDVRHPNPAQGYDVARGLSEPGAGGRRYARGLAHARETAAAVDRMVADGRLVRTLFDEGDYRTTRVMRGEGVGREPRFNPHHDHATGKFSSGGSVRAAGRTTRVDELHAHVAGAAAAHGADMRLEIRSPRSEAGRRMSAEAEAKGKYLVQTTDAPKYATDHAGPYLSHRVGGQLVATTFPASRTPGLPRDPSDKRWVSRTHSRTYDPADPTTTVHRHEDAHFRTRRAATRHSRKAALDEAVAGTYRAAHQTSDFGRFVRGHAATRAGSADHFHTKVDLVTPAGGGREG